MQPIEREDFLQYRFPSALAVSPGGSRAVFCLCQAQKQANSYHSQLWQLPLPGAGAQPLPGTEGARSFCFLDDATILYPCLAQPEDRQRAQAGELLTVFHTMDLATGQGAEAFRVPLKNATARKVRDGLFLLACIRDNSRPDIEALPPAQRNAALEAWRQEQDFEVCDELPFLADGRGFVNKERHALYLYDQAQGRLCALTEPFFETSFSAISPDGAFIAYSGIHYDRYYVRTHGIFLYDVATGATRTLLTPGSYQVMGLDFLGDALAVAAAPWNGEGAFPNHNLYTLPLAGGPMQLRHIHDREDFGSKTCSDCRYGGGATFKVAGDTLYYFTTCDTYAYINAWQPGQAPRRLNPPELVPDSLALGRGALLATGMTTGLQEIFSLDGQGGFTPCTQLNTEALQGKAVAQPRKFQFTDRDGFTVSGFVLEPAGYDPAKKYPGILQIHGGPRAAFAPVFFHELQYLAGKGYFVFYCNPRGSAGSGEAFADIRNCRGTVDYEDVMQWTDFVLAQYPAIDDQRLGVMGGSYGGYMTNWVITHTRRFRAAVSMRSIVDLVAGYGATDCGVWGTPGVYGGTPWSHDELLREQSPLTYAMSVTTPTLFLHSFEDYRCTLTGAMQLYSALQIKGVPTRMCLFRGECHELSRSGKPRSRIRRLKELADWVDLYLAPERS